MSFKRFWSNPLGPTKDNFFNRARRNENNHSFIRKKLACHGKVLVGTNHAYDYSGLKEKGRDRLGSDSATKNQGKKLASSIAASSLGFNILRADPGIGKREKKKAARANEKLTRNKMEREEEKLEIMWDGDDSPSGFCG